MQTYNSFDLNKHELIFQTSAKLLNTSSRFILMLNKLLKVHKLTFQQYYVLRIAKFASNGISIKYISANMIDPSSNTSRLIDKLISKGLLKKEISSIDRRSVHIYLTENGLLTIDLAMKTLSDALKRKASNLSDKEVLELSDLLDVVRNVIKD